MDLEELKGRLEAVQAEVYVLVEARRSAARQPGASARDRQLAGEADKIVEVAAERARALPEDELERRIQALRRWGEGRAAVAVAEANAAVRLGRSADLQGALEAALGSAGAELDLYQQEVEIWLAEHALAAWTDAWVELQAAESA